MCLAIRYPLERELVEQLHQNITKQQISNLALLQKQQQQMTEGHLQGMASLERIHQAQEHLWQQWQLNMMDMHEKTKHDLSDIADLILSMQHDLQLKQQEQLMHLDIIDSSLKQRLNALWDTTEHELQQILGHVEARMRYMQSGMESTLMLQRQVSIEWRAIQDTQIVAVKQWQVMMSEMNTTLSSMLNTTSQNILHLQNDIQSVHRQFQSMLEPLSHVGIVLLLVIGTRFLVASPFRWTIATVLLYLLLPYRYAQAIIFLFWVLMYAKKKYSHIQQSPTRAARQLRLYHDMIQ
ncbi:hypothetical protein LRAMOSA01436 [Lichtheimia ramosa]|uniref:Uncharacterized protein n=1 Tax=Lichtheimia ramosa TaxID=688394 RepID=A0A077WLT2_9FUNG|nr:hypothetical protein LRAMOSA01436 [Lichtheimia ramosa]